MKSDNIPLQQQEQPILSVIQKIKDGSLDPKNLDREARQQCVEVFLAEGYTISAMAQILAKSEKTIQRDLSEIRDKNAISPSVNLAKKIIGELLTFARLHRGHLMRLARSKDASVAEKAQAEYYAARVGVEIVSKMQTLGYLPLKPQEIVADFSHHIDVDEKSFAQLRDELVEIEKISKQCGELTPDLRKELKELSCRIEKAELQSKVIEISTKQKHK